MLKVLVAVDDSPYSDAIIQMLSAEMRPADTTLRLLHVADPFPTRRAQAKGSKEYPDYETARHEQYEEARQLLTSAAARLEAAGFSTEWTVHEGDARGEILDEAQAWGADLIVLGSHGRSGLKRLLTGSVSDAVVHHAACSVEIVRVIHAAH
ncbi:MAG TPA: universal stress protein [Terriglobia bacterium]|jgi:nucleotide-binding universal stress UspA family protein